MKNLKLITIFIFLLLIGSLSAQTKLNEENLKSSLSKIFDLSKDQNFKDVAPMLINIKGKTIQTFDFNKKTDTKSVKRLAKKIKAYLDLSDSYEYESITYGTTDKLPSAELKVNFRSGDQNLTISFIFVEHANKIYLAKFN